MISNEIPTQIKQFAKSKELSTGIQKISDVFDLHIDQIGELGAEIRDVLLGLSESADFSKHISERLEVNREMADKITAEVNKEIFGAIKSQMQSDIQERRPEISDLERIGDFRIIKEGDNSKNGNGNGTVGIENIQADNLLKNTVKSTATTIQTIKKSIVPETPLVKPPAIQESQIPQSPSEKPAAPAQTIPKKVYENDPYREPF